MEARCSTRVIVTVVTSPGLVSSSVPLISVRLSIAIFHRDRTSMLSSQPIVNAGNNDFSKSVVPFYASRRKNVCDRNFLGNGANDVSRLCFFFFLFFFERISTRRCHGSLLCARHSFRFTRPKKNRGAWITSRCSDTSGAFPLPIFLFSQVPFCRFLRNFTNKGTELSVSRYVTTAGTETESELLLCSRTPFIRTPVERQTVDTYLIQT